MLGVDQIASEVFQVLSSKRPINFNGQQRAPQMFESQECIAENYAVLLARYLEPSFFEIQEDNMNVCYWKRTAWSCPLYFALPYQYHNSDAVGRELSRVKKLQ